MHDMHEKCLGSGKRPKRIDSAGLGECPKCGTTVRIRDGKLRSHVTVEAANAFRANLWSLFR